MLEFTLKPYKSLATTKTLTLMPITNKKTREQANYVCDKMM